MLHPRGAGKRDLHSRRQQLRRDVDMQVDYLQHQQKLLENHPHTQQHADDHCDQGEPSEKEEEISHLRYRFARVRLDVVESADRDAFCGRNQLPNHVAVL